MATNPYLELANAEETGEVTATPANPYAALPTAEETGEEAFIAPVAEEAITAEVAPTQRPADIQDPTGLDLVRYAAGGVPQGLIFDVLEIPGLIGMAGEVSSKIIDEVITGTLGETAGKVIEATSPVGMLSRGFKAIDKFKDEKLPFLETLRGFLAPTISEEELEEAGSAGVAAQSIRTINEWMSGGLLRGGVQLAKRGVEAGLRTMIPDVSGGILAAAGEQVAGEAGEVIGGFTGIIASLRKGDISGLSQLDRQAVEFIRQNAHDADQVFRDLEKASANNELGNIADWTSDQGIHDIVASVGRYDANIGRSLDQSTQARDVQNATDAARVFGAEDLARGEGADAARRIADEAVEGEITTLENIARGQTKAATTRAATQAGKLKDNSVAASNAAKEQAKDTVAAENLVGTQLDVSTANEQLADSVVALRAAEKKSFEDPAWQAFREGDNLDANDFVKAFYANVNEAPAHIRAGMEKGEFSGIFDTIKRWEETGVIERADLAAVLSDIKHINRTAAVSPQGSSAANKFMADAVKKMDKGLKESDPLYRAAQAATLKRVKRTQLFNRNKKRIQDNPEQFLSKAKLTGEGGAVTARLVREANDPTVSAAVDDMLKASGNIDGITDKFMTNYRHLLSLNPQLKAKFQAVVDANAAKAGTDEAKEAAAKELEKFRTQRKKDIKARKKKDETKINKIGTKGRNTLMGMYANAPDKELTRLLTPDRVGDLRALYEGVSAAGGGPAFKAHVRDNLMKSLTDPTAVKGVRSVSEKATKNFNEIVDTLVASDILTDAEAGAIGTALARSTDSAALRKSSIDKLLSNPNSELDSLIASGMAAAAMTAMPGGQSLILAGAARRFFKERLRKKVSPAELSRIENFMLNPSQMFNAMKDIDNVADAMRFIETQIVMGGQLGAAVAPEQETTQ